MLNWSNIKKDIPASLTAFILFVLVFTVYFNSVKNPFYYDDFKLIVNNKGITSFNNLRYILNKEIYYNIFQQPTYRPFTVIIYTFLKQFFGGQSSYWRLFNIFVHFANCFLLFLVLRRLKITSGIAFWAASLFAVHTVHTELINMISLNSDIIGSFLCLLAFYCFTRKGIIWRSVSLSFYLLSWTLE